MARPGLPHGSHPTRGRWMTAVITVAVLVVFAPAVHAQLRHSVSVTTTGGIVRVSDWDFAGLGVAGFDLGIDSTGSDTVRARIELNAVVDDDVSVGVSKAFVRARFPLVRVTAGLARASWGKGFLYNAGDLIFLPGAVPGELFATDFQVATDLMLIGYLPLGPRSFAEIIVLPPAFTAPGIPGGIDQTRAGARISAPLGPAAIELGYLVDGTGEPAASDGLHRGFLAGQVPVFGTDLYASVRSGLPFGPFDTAALRDLLTLSAGFNRSLSLYYGSFSLSFRMEALLRTAGEWSAISAIGIDPGYGLFLFPDVTFALSDTTSFSARSLISAVDGSAVVISGLHWAPLQGLAIDAFVTAMVGGSSDLFGWDRANDLSAVVTLSYDFGSN